jgi:hypothetical protein
MTTRKQKRANRLNARKGGPKTQAGKAVSRLNARKYGIFLSVLTEADRQELRDIQRRLVEAIRPGGARRGGAGRGTRQDPPEPAALRTGRGGGACAGVRAGG